MIYCWNPVPNGWKVVEFSETFRNNLNIPEDVLQDLLAGRRHIIRKEKKSQRLSATGSWFSRIQQMCKNIINQ